MDDTQTIAAILKGDRTPYEGLVERHKRMVYAIAWSQLGNSDLSEDAAQETFVKAYCYLRTLRDPGRFSFWLAQIARNVCKKFRRAAAREADVIRRWTISEPVDHSATIDVDPESPESQLWESFAELPNTHREALTVFYIEGRNIQEAAQVLGISESAMKVRLHRARTALRAQLEDRLEVSLKKLQPSKRFTPSVMSLLPISPIGLFGSGALTATIGKLVAAGAWMWWLVLAQFALIGGFAYWKYKSDIDNIKDVPENAFQKRQPRRMFIGMLVSVLVGGLAMAVVNWYFQYRGPTSFSAARLLSDSDHIKLLYRILPVPFVFLLWPTLRLLRVNRSVYAAGSTASMVMMGACCLTVGIAGMPIADISTYVPMMALGMTVLSFAMTFGQRPWRTDYNLFLRGATGGIADVDEPSAPVPHLSDLELITFAKFLGGQWLAWDYVLRGDTMLLKPAGIIGGTNRLSFFLWDLIGGSHIAITRTGQCIAFITNADLKTIEKLTQVPIDIDVLQTEVSRAMAVALRAFFDNDVALARQTLTARTDESIFRKKPSDLPIRTMSVLTVVLVLIGLGMQHRLQQRERQRAMRLMRQHAVTRPHVKETTGNP